MTEKVKFYSNNLKDYVLAEVLEKREKTWKLKVPTNSYYKIETKEKKDLISCKKKFPTAKKFEYFYKINHIFYKIKKVMKEKIVIKKINQLECL